MRTNRLAALPRDSSSLRAQLNKELAALKLFREPRTGKTFREKPITAAGGLAEVAYFNALLVSVALPISDKECDFMLFG